MKKPVYWVLLVLAAATFTYLIRTTPEVTNVNTGVNFIRNTVKKTANTAKNTVTSGADALGDVAEGAVDVVASGADALEDVADTVASGTDTLADAAKNAVEGTVEAVEDGVEIVEDTVEKAVQEGENLVDDVADEVEEVIVEHDGYVEFSETALKESLEKDEKVALFFHAERCPSCINLDLDIDASKETIESGTTVFKVDYDTAEALKEKYSVVKQHTVVYLDTEGKATDTKLGILSLKDLVGNFNK